MGPPPHPQCFFTGHRLTGEMPKGEVHRVGFGVQAVPIHDALDIAVFDLDVGA